MEEGTQLMIGVLAYLAIVCASANVSIGLIVSGADVLITSGGFFGIFLAMGLAMLYSKVEVPVLWAVIGNFVAILFNLIFFSLGITYTLPSGGFTLFITSIFLLAPAILTPIIRTRGKAMHKRMRKVKELDPKILDTASKFGGILTKSVVVHDLQVPLELAERSLRRFQEHEECEIKKTEGITIYDFKSARTHLSSIENRVVDLLRDNPYGMSRAALLQEMEIGLEALEEILTRLERYGITTYDKTTEEYKLKGIVMK